jgi:hypothetical protein
VYLQYPLKVPSKCIAKDIDNQSHLENYTKKLFKVLNLLVIGSELKDCRNEKQALRNKEN